MNELRAHSNERGHEHIWLRKIFDNSIIKTLKLSMLNLNKFYVGDLQRDFLESTNSFHS